MLAVEAWLAAPLFFFAGPSVTVLKLPLLGMHLAITALLLVVLERELKLPPGPGLRANPVLHRGSHRDNRIDAADERR